MTSVFSAHVAAALAFFHVLSSRDGALLIGPVSPPVLAVQIFCFVLLALSMTAGLRSEMGKRATQFVLLEDGTVLCRAQGSELLYRPESGAVDFGWGVWMRLRPDAGVVGGVRRWMLVSGNVRPACWRGLRTWLRHKAYRASPDT